MRRTALVVGAAVGILALPATAQADSLRLAPIARGLSNPIYVTTPPNDGNRVFIVLKGGDSNYKAAFRRKRSPQWSQINLLDLVANSTPEAASTTRPTAPLLGTGSGQGRQR